MMRPIRISLAAFCLLIASTAARRTDENTTTAAPTAPPNSSNVTTAAPTAAGNATTAAPTAAGNETTLAPTAAPKNATTTAPTAAPTNVTNITTVAPTATPTAAPNVTTVAPTSSAPTAAPSATPPAPHHHKLSFWRILGKTIAWCIIILLVFLAFGAVMSNRYRIFYFLRGVWYTILSLDCTQWVLRKATGRDYQPVDASLNTIIFESNNEMTDGLLMRETD